MARREKHGRLSSEGGGRAKQPPYATFINVRVSRMFAIRPIRAVSSCTLCGLKKRNLVEPALLSLTLFIIVLTVYLRLFK